MLVDKVKDVGGLVIKKAPPEDKELKLKEKAFLRSVSGDHHANLETKFFKGVGMLGGCGAMHLYDVHSLQYHNITSIKKDFTDFLKKAKARSNSPCATFIARLGINKDGEKYTNLYGTAEAILLQLGFKIIAEYRNAAHPSYPRDYQRLYIYTDI